MNEMKNVFLNPGPSPAPMGSYRSSAIPLAEAVKKGDKANQFVREVWRLETFLTPPQGAAEKTDNEIKAQVEVLEGYLRTIASHPYLEKAQELIEYAKYRLDPNYCSACV